MEYRLVLNASLMEELEVHTCRLAPAESLASSQMEGRVSSHINSDGEEDGDIDVVEYDCGDDDDQITMAACE